MTINLVVFPAAILGLFVVLAESSPPNSEQTAASQSASRPASSASLPARPGTATTQAQRRRIHAFVSGRVQGVGFRDFTQEHAQELHLTGFVRNLKDGRVEVDAEGSKQDVAELMKQIKKGPPGARVDKCDVTDETPTGESGEFRVKR